MNKEFGDMMNAFQSFELPENLTSEKLQNFIDEHLERYTAMEIEAYKGNKNIRIDEVQYYTNIWAQIAEQNAPALKRGIKDTWESLTNAQKTEIIDALMELE